MPLISVLMAARNYARFLPDAVRSVQDQTFADWELIVIDDGSTDDTAKAIRPFLADCRIRFVQSDRLGQSRAKNLAAALARGQFLAYLDADDAWRPEKLEKQLSLILANPKVGVCFTRRDLFDEGGKLLPNRDPLPTRGNVLEAVFLRNFVCFSSVLIRRELLAQIGRFDPEWDLAIDYDLWLRAAAHCEFDYVDEPLVLYRTGHGNLSKRLSDRVATADAIALRALRRPAVAETISIGTKAEGFASTYRAIGYTLRRSEPAVALVWYWRAFTQPSRRWMSLKGMIASMLCLLRPRIPGTAENATVNR